MNYDQHQMKGRHLKMGSSEIVFQSVGSISLICFKPQRKDQHCCFRISVIQFVLRICFNSVVPVDAIWLYLVVNTDFFKTYIRVLMWTYLCRSHWSLHVKTLIARVDTVTDRQQMEIFSSKPSNLQGQ